MKEVVWFVTPKAKTLANVRSMIPRFILIMFKLHGVFMDPSEVERLVVSP